MPDIIYRFDPDGAKVPPPPADAAAAKTRLLQGNRTFVNLFKEPQIVHVAPSAIGIGSGDAPLSQRPFASILSCSDARVPVEFVFRCGSNELFVVRVAGNVPGAECLGSLEYAAGPMECGVFDLTSREATLEAPPADAEAFVELAGEVAASERIRQLLGS